MENDSTERTERLEGLVAVREYPKVDHDMPEKEGLRIMIERLGLTAQKVRLMVYDRMPHKEVKPDMYGIRRFLFKHYLKFDIVYSDILHVGYEELKHIGYGRRFLMNRILRTILAGICDGLDPTGRSGDFPPRSWLDKSESERILDVQEKSMRILEEYNSKLLQSVKVRIRRISTTVLQELSLQLTRIRREVRKATEKDQMSGLRRFSRILSETRKGFVYRTRMYDINNRAKTSQGKTRTLKNRAQQVASAMLIKGLTDLRKLQDPRYPCWYRRPTDHDWYEGMRSDRRIPVHYNRSKELNKRGFGDIPGLTGPLPVEDWGKQRTDYSTAEAREMYRKNHPEH